MSNLLDAPIKHLLESLYLMGIGDEHGCRVNIPISDLIAILEQGGVTLMVDLENEGVGVELYNGNNPTNHKPKIARINCEDGTINISKKEDGTLLISANMPSIDYPVINGKSVGSISENTESVFIELKNKILDFRKITSSDDSVKVSLTDDGKLNLTIPKIEDDSIKQYYVDALYSKEGNGTISRPYKTLTKALTDIIGNGTAVNPQYRNSIIYLLNDITVNQDEFDNPTNSKLNNRLSVNTIKIASADASKKSITYNGSSAYEYPFNTESLVNQDLNGGTVLSQSITIIFDNIKLVSNSTYGVVYGLSYDGHGVKDGSSPTSALVLTNCTVLSTFKNNDTSIYSNLTNEDGSNVLMYGEKVKGQTLIPINSNSALLLKGKGNTNVGQFNIFNLEAIATAVSAIECKQTVVGFFGETKLSINQHRLPVNSLVPESSSTNGSRYKPKEGIAFIINDSSSITFNELNLAYSHPTAISSITGITTTSYIGGLSALFLLKNTTSNPEYSMFVNKGSISSVYLKNYLRVESVDNAVVRMNNCIYGNISVKIDETAFKKTIGSPMEINCDDSSFINVGTSINTNISIEASKAVINNFDFSSKPSFTSDTHAINSHGLIEGNIYYNTTIKAMKKITNPPTP